MQRQPVRSDASLSFFSKTEKLIERQCQICLTVLLFLFLSVSNGRAQAPQTDVDTFYQYILTAASQAGYDTSPISGGQSAEFKASVASYFWGFPLEETFRTQIIFNNTFAPENHFYNANALDTSNSVVTPNLNVLYSSAWLDLSGSSAFVISMPDTTSTANPAGVFNSLQIMNAYTDVVGSFGTRTDNSNSGLRYLVVGPEFDLAGAGPLPAGIHDIVQVNTTQAWVLGRIQVDPYAEGMKNGVPTPYHEAVNGEGSPSPYALSNIIDLNNQFTRTTLEDYREGHVTPNTPITTPTEEQLEEARRHSSSHTGTAFLEYLGESVLKNGIPESGPGSGSNQSGMFDNFQRIGLTENGFSMDNLTPEQIADITNGINNAAAMLAAISNAATASNGWKMDPTLGIYDPSYAGWIKAAITAQVGLGANLGVDAVYPSTSVDSEGRLLNGSEAYTLTLSMPLPIDELGFWSLSVYDADHFIVGNDGNTFYGPNVYSLSSSQAPFFVENEDGTITLYLQHNPVDESLMANWLPTPEGDFNVVLRFYYPTDDILNGVWLTPDLIRVIPEPSTWLMLLSGIGGLLLLGEKRRKRAA